MFPLLSRGASLPLLLVLAGCGAHHASSKTLATADDPAAALEVVIRLAAAQSTPNLCVDAAGPAILQFAGVSPGAEINAAKPNAEYFAPPGWTWAKLYPADPRVERAVAQFEARGAPAKRVYAVFVAHPDMTGQPVALPLADRTLRVPNR